MEAFDFSLKILGLLGYYPTKSKFGKLINAMFYFNCLNNFVFSVAQLLFIYFNRHDFNVFIGAIFMLMTASYGNFQNYWCGIKNKDITYMVNYLDMTILQPKNDSQNAIIKTFDKYIKMTGQAIIVLVVVLLTCWFYLPFRDWQKKVLIINIWVPFDYNNSDVMFSLILLAEAIFVAHLVVGALGSYLIILSLMGAATIEFDLLGDSLKNIASLSQIGMEECDVKMVKMLITCVKQYELIKGFVDYFMDVFNLPLTIFFSVSVITFCSTIMQGTNSTLDLSQVLFVICFGAVILTAVVLFCWFGQQIMSASDQMLIAAYQCDWDGASMRFKKILCILMIRLKFPIVIRLSKLIPVTMLTFTQILQMTWSYYTVMSQIRQQEADNAES